MKVSEQKVSIGRIVIYKLNEHDAGIINRRRVAKPQEPNWVPGTQAHVGNQVAAGEEYPLVVTKVWNAETGMINGQLLLDGNDVLWITSAKENDPNCGWRWPPRV